MLEIEEKSYEQGRIDGLREAWDIVDFWREQLRNDINTLPKELNMINNILNNIAYRESN
jgi:hypothetical protein